MDTNATVGRALKETSALVSFSGGQDSTTALAWALSRYTTVETVGFRYGQKHMVEMECRPVIRKAIAELNSGWAERLGPDHVVELDLIGQITAKKIAAPKRESATTIEGFAAGARYIPGRNLIMLSLGASVAFRRDIRNLVCGASETEYSGYPDCQSNSMTAIEKAINLCSGLDFRIECPLMPLGKAGVWNLAQELGGAKLVELIAEETHTCYLGSREVRHQWGYGCGGCAACQLRAKGWREFVRL